MSQESVINKLIRIIYRAREAEDDYLGALSDGERAAHGTYQDWAPKDLLAHINYWRKRVVESLAYHSRMQPPPDYPDFEVSNRENFEQNVDLPLEFHLREARTIIKSLEEVLPRFEDEDLTDPQRYPWRKGTPLISSIISNCYLHPINHLCINYLKIGNHAIAFQLQEEVVREVSEIHDSPASRNLALYDLACFFAQTGNLDKAIEKLTEVLPFSNELADWSRQDPDLVALQDDPRYLALIAR